MKVVFFTCGLVLMALFAFSTKLSANEPFAENAHYKRVSSGNTATIGHSNKIEVIEFFLYSCSHCYELEPKLKNWLDTNKDKVTFKRVPAVIAPSWVTLAKTYYIAEKLGVLDQTHEALFKSIHVDKKVYLNEYKLTEFFSAYGIAPNVFLHEFNSKDIVDKVSDARILSVKYAFRGVPAIVINDEFKTAPFYTKDQEQMLEVMDYLLAKITTAKASD